MTNPSDPVTPASEATRLTALHRYDIVDTPAEAAFDDIVALAAHICAVPISVIALVDAERQWLKAAVGMAVGEASRDSGLCPADVLGGEFLVVPDTRLDPRFATQPFVVGAPLLRFYAGVPLLTPDGCVLGSLCVADHEPRQLRAEQLRALEALQRSVMHLLELRRTNQRLAQTLDQQRQSEAALQHVARNLRETNHFLDSIVDNIPSLLCVKDAQELRVLRVNRAVEAALGRPREQLVGETIADLLPPEQAERVARRHRRVLADVRPGEVTEEPFDSAAGRRVLRTQSVPVVNEAGTPVYVLDISEDITEQTEMDTALRETREWLQHAVRYSGLCLWDWNLRTGQSRFSDEWIRGLGYEPSDLVALEDWAAKIHPDDRERIAAAVAHHYAQPQDDYEVEYRLCDKSGSYHWILSRASSELDADGTPQRMLGVYLDITKLKQTEAAMRGLNLDLDRHARDLAAANDELEAFSYSVSHDLRAPLRAIEGFSRVLAEEHLAELSEAGRAHVTRVRDAVGRMNALIDALLDLARIARSDLRRCDVDLSALAGEILADLRQNHPTRTIEVAIAPGMVAYGDPQLLHIALTNLLANAWKYTGPRRQGRIEVGAVNVGAALRYFVRDNGVGFDMADAERLFGPFQRLHRRDQFEGSGVGLATVQRIVRRHGGRIWADAAVDQGATFYFTLDDQRA